MLTQVSDSYSSHGYEPGTRLFDRFSWDSVFWASSSTSFSVLHSNISSFVSSSSTSSLSMFIEWASVLWAWPPSRLFCCSQRFKSHPLLSSRHHHDQSCHYECQGFPLPKRNWLEHKNAWMIDNHDLLMMNMLMFDDDDDDDSSSLYSRMTYRKAFVEAWHTMPCPLFLLKEHCSRNDWHCDTEVGVLLLPNCYQGRQSTFVL